MLDEILALNRRAAANGDFETAYHLLMAALHDAEHRAEEAALASIDAIAREQADAVDAIRPPHQLSRQQAAKRGQTSVFDSLQAHIEAVRLRMQSERQLRGRRR
jgi:hypothetical protein